MNGRFKRSITLLTLVMMLTLSFPLSLLATDNEAVLTSIYHSSAIAAADVTGSNSATFTVPYAFGSTLDLANGLDISYDTSLYAFASAGFSSGSIAAVDGDAVEMTLTYQKQGEDTKTSLYYINVVRAAFNAPTFSGTISKSSTLAGLPGSISFSAADFTARYTQNDGGALNSIIINGSNPTFGSLKLGGSNYSLGQKISAANLGTLSFAASDTGSVSYTVNAFAAGDDDTMIGSVVLNISVDQITSIGTVSYSTNKNTAVKLNATDFNTALNNATGYTLSHVKFTLPSASYGKLYYNYTSSTNYDSLVTADTEYYRSASPQLSNVSFVPYTGYSGSVSINFTAYTADNKSYTGTLSITVVDTGDSNVSYSTNNATPVKLVASDFNTACKNATGSNLDYIKFTLPSSTYGVLYYNYTSSSQYDSKVSASSKYYRSGSPYIAYISFVPNSSYSGTVSINYTGYDVDGKSYSGKLNITVSSSGSSTVSYSTDNDTPVKLVASDFNTACKNATGSNLDYIKFSLPSSTYGVLYYNYTSSSKYDSKVSASTKYYRSSSPYLYNISFVPNTSYSGTVTISYTGYDVDGQSYSGKLNITVSSSGSSTISYSTDNDTPVKLVASDFNTACKNATGSNLDYIKFTLPSSTYGILYYNYTSSSKYDSKVSASTKYYRSSSPYLYNISFVPKTSYSGTVTISYTGYDVNGDSYSGKLKITVSDQGDSTVSYSTDNDTPVKLVASDFNTACKNATGSNLDYVKFSLPSSTYGVLYYDYTSSSDYGSKVSASTKYYRSDSPYISYISFVPNTSYSGTVTISYTGYDVDGDSYSGKLKITVSSDGSSTVSYSTNSQTPVKLVASDFNTACKNATGSTLDYVKFTLPSSTYGVLYYDYSSASKYDSKVSASTKYYRSDSPYIAYISFVPNSSYTGTITINFTGYDVDGDSFSGQLKITVTGNGSTELSYSTNNTTPLKLVASDFNDICRNTTGNTLDYVKFSLPSSTYGKLYYDYTSASKYDSAVSASTKYYRNSSPYISYISFVPNSNYTGTVTINYTGYSTEGTSYSGKLKITVNDTGISSKYFNDVGSNLSWAVEAIDYLYEAGVVTGIGSNRYMPSASVTRGDFMLMLYRALDLKATVQDNFSDVPKGSYYFDAIAAAKALGIAQGDGKKFYPNSAISRQDAMVLVVRSLEVARINIASGSSSDLRAFTDRGMVSDYAIEAVASLVKAKIIQGDGSSVHPLSNITRAEMAVILQRVLKL